MRAGRLARFAGLLLPTKLIVELPIRCSRFAKSCLAAPTGINWFKVGDALRIGIQRVALNERARSDDGRTHRTVEGWHAIDHATPAIITVVLPV